MTALEIYIDYLRTCISARQVHSVEALRHYSVQHKAIQASCIGLFYTHLRISEPPEIKAGGAHLVSRVPGEPFSVKFCLH